MVEFCELCVIFLSTPSARRATFNKVHKTNLKYISIHALCEEGDVTAVEAGTGSNVFLSTPSARRATCSSGCRYRHQAISIHALCEEGDVSRFLLWTSCGYFYPRPLRGGRPAAHLHGLIGHSISIHALCEEGDLRRGAAQRNRMISIHALCEEGDLHCWDNVQAANEFLSTPSARRATNGGGYKMGLKRFLSTPSARRATGLTQKLRDICQISIHALCEEGDRSVSFRSPSQKDFYPRPLRGGRPAVPQAGRPGADISIHALCEEGDLRIWANKQFSRKFLSTPSARRATSV